MRIIIGCDHAGLDLKRSLLGSILADRGVVDLGVDSAEPVDYPDIAERAARMIAGGEADRAILICGTGIGMAIAAGRTPGVRAAACVEPYTAELSRRHNDANVLCLGGRVTGPGIAERIVATWLDAPFDGDRHARRVAKIEGRVRRS